MSMYGAVPVVGMVWGPPSAKKEFETTGKLPTGSSNHPAAPSRNLGSAGQRPSAR